MRKLVAALGQSSTNRSTTRSPLLVSMITLIPPAAYQPAAARALRPAPAGLPASCVGGRLRWASAGSGGGGGESGSERGSVAAAPSGACAYCRSLAGCAEATDCSPGRAAAALAGDGAPPGVLAQDRSRRLPASAPNRSLGAPRLRRLWAARDVAATSAWRAATAFDCQQKGRDARRVQADEPTASPLAGAPPCSGEAAAEQAHALVAAHPACTMRPDCWWKCSVAC